MDTNKLKQSRKTYHGTRCNCYGGHNSNSGRCRNGIEGLDAYCQDCQNNCGKFGVNHVEREKAQLYAQRDQLEEVVDVLTKFYQAIPASLDLQSVDIDALRAAQTLVQKHVAGDGNIILTPVYNLVARVMNCSRLGVDFSLDLVPGGQHVANVTLKNTGETNSSGALSYKMGVSEGDKVSRELLEQILMWYLNTVYTSVQVGETVTLLEKVYLDEAV